MQHVEVQRTTIFTNDVYSFELPNFSSWKQKILNIVNIENNGLIISKPDEECSVKAGRTAWNSHLRYKDLDDLSNIVTDIIKSSVHDEGYDIPELGVLDCWINWYKNNEFTEKHTHRNYLAVVLFVDTNNSTGDFYFHQDVQSIFSKKVDADTNYVSDLRKIDIKDGTVIFFDGSLNHSVSPNTTRNLRITTAWNLKPYYPEK